MHLQGDNSSCPDMDFTVRAILVSSKRYQSVAALTYALLATWFALDEDVVRRPCHFVTSRLELMVKAKRMSF